MKTSISVVIFKSCISTLAPPSKQYWEIFKFFRAARIIDFLCVLAQEFIKVSGRVEKA